MYVTADNYDARSRNPYCSVSGLPKLPGETRIFRLADIEFEGSFDIGEAVVVDMAKELGMVPSDAHLAALDDLATAESALAKSEKARERLVLLVENLRKERHELIAEIYERDNEVHDDAEDEAE